MKIIFDNELKNSMEYYPPLTYNRIDDFDIDRIEKFMFD